MGGVDADALGRRARPRSGRPPNSSRPRAVKKVGAAPARAASWMTETPPPPPGSAQLACVRQDLAGQGHPRHSGRSPPTRRGRRPRRISHGPRRHVQQDDGSGDRPAVRAVYAEHGDAVFGTSCACSGGARRGCLPGDVFPGPPRLRRPASRELSPRLGLHDRHTGRRRAPATTPRADCRARRRDAMIGPGTRDRAFRGRAPGEGAGRGRAPLRRRLSDSESAPHWAPARRPPARPLPPECGACEGG